MALTTTGGSLGAANANVAVDVEQNSTFSGVVTGTFVGTVTFQALYDPTEGWVAAQTFTRPGVSAAAALTAPGNRIINTGGAIAVRAAMTAYTSGTAAVTLAGTPAASGASSGGGGGGGAVTVADGADVAQGTTTDAGIITDINGTVIGFLRGAILRWNTYLARIPAALTGSGNFKVSVAESTAPQAVTNANLDAALSTLVPTTDFDTKTGSLTETAPATDTASSGLNGRLQRIAQRITSLIALFPSALISNRLDVNLGAAPATVTAQGTAASGAAVSGNPVLVGGSDGTNAQTWLSGTASGLGMQRMVAGISASGTDAVANSAGFNFVGQAGVAGIPIVWQDLFNGTTWDRARNTVEVTLLASASRTTTQTSADITTYNAAAITLIYDNTIGTTYSDTVTINGKDPASGKYYLLLSSAAIATVTTNVYVVDPNVPAVANVSAQKRLPRTIQVVVTSGNGNAHTYSVGYILHPV